MFMLTTELFIAIISLCITCFALGYAVGTKSNKVIIRHKLELDILPSVNYNGTNVR